MIILNTNLKKTVRVRNRKELITLIIIKKENYLSILRKKKGEEKE